jgi:hypothetical protein
MKHFIISILIVVSLVISTTHLSAQFSLGLRGAYSMHYAMPDGMRGTIDQAFGDFFVYGDVTRYPFAEPGTTSSRIAVDAEYMLTNSVGVYGVLGTTTFRTERASNANTQSAFMRLVTLSGGIATKVGIVGELSWISRLGMNTSVISGDISYSFGVPQLQKATMITTVRGGIELETGLRYRVASRIDVEAVVSGAVMNLIGRNSNTTSGLADGEFYLNDAEKILLRGERIAPKDITFLMFQLGVRYSL